MLIHHAPDGYWTGQSLEIDDRAPVPIGWIVAPAPPEVPAGQAAMWSDGWVIVDAPAPDAPTAEDICDQIDAERDRRQALDFAYDFGDVVAVLDDGTQERAGIRSLQMAPRNKTDWLGQQARALDAMRRELPDTIIFIRVSDNANLLVPAWLWLDVFEAGAARDERLMAFGGPLKTQVRAAVDPSMVDWQAGWPS